MAETRTVNLEIKDNVKSLKTQYREAVQEVQRLADAYGATSTEAANAAKNAANLKDRIEESKSLTDAFNPDAKFNALSGAIGGVLNGFQAYEGAMGLIGVENEELQKTLLKVQSAMALSQGIQGALEAKDAFKNLGSVLKNTAIGQGLLTAATTAYNFVTTATTKGLKLFRIALISTGVGALVVGVGLLVANFDKLLNVFTPVIDGLKNIGDAIGLTDFAGKERAKNEQERYENERKNIERNNELRQIAFDNEQKGIQRTIDLYKAQGKDVTELTRLKLKNSLDVKKALLEEILLLEENAKFYAERGTNLQKTVSNAIIDNASLVKQEILDIENEIAIFDINAKKDAIDRNKGFSDKQRELNRQIEKERIDAMEDGMEKRLALLKFNEEGELSAIIGKGKKEGELRTSIETRYEKERNKVKEEFRVRRDRDEDVSLEKRPVKRLEIGKQEIDAESYVQSELLRLEQEADDKRKANTIQRTDQILKAAQTFTQVYSSLNGLLNASDNERLKKVEKGSKEEQKIKKRMFNRDKALRISQTVVDTASNIVTSVRNGGGIPTGIPFGIAAGAMGALQIAAITKAKYDGGETPSASGGGDVASGGGASTTPQFNTIGSSGVNQLAQLQQQPVQAYVVSGDVTSAQSLDRNRIQNATL